MFRVATLKFKVLLIVSVTVFVAMAALSAILTLLEVRTVRHDVRIGLDTALSVLSFDLNSIYQNEGFQRTFGENGRVDDIRWPSIVAFTSHDSADNSAEQTLSVVSVLQWEPSRNVFTRVSTSAAAQDGTRLVGTALSGELSNTLRNRRALEAEVKFGDAWFVAKLIPILDTGGVVVGALEAALPKEVLTGPLTQIAVLSIAVTIILAVAAVGLATFVLPRTLKPIDDLNSAVQRISSGNYSAEVPHTELPDVIGEIARSLEALEKELDNAKALREERRVASAEAARKVEIETATQNRVVEDLSLGLRRLAAGDLTQPIDSPSDNPFPETYDGLRQSYNQVLDQMGHTVLELNDVVQGVRNSAGEIDHAASDLAARAETQAATLEQSAAALSQLTESVRATSERANQAEAAGRNSRERAESGTEIVRDAVEAMHEIEGSSDSVSRIIGVIDDIAFQTNLLALNAGVEAARAGDAGKGFAVVASEVRALAQRASESAREIKSLISISSTQVEEGSRLVSSTGERLEDILNHTVELQGLISEIAEAAREQATGLSEINSGVHQLDTVTQQNAAVAEEANAASASLNQKSDELVQCLGSFRTAMSGSLAAVSWDKSVPTPSGTAEFGPEPKTSTRSIGEGQPNPEVDFAGF